MRELANASVPLRGHELRYVDQGSGPAILLVHGLLGSHRLWAHVIDGLATQHRVVAPDLFGHGSSAKPRGDYSLGGYAAALRDLLDHLGIDRVTIVGHSLGGGIAMQFHYLFPGRVERLILVSSSGLGREITPLLRLGTLPSAELVLPILASAPVRWVSTAVARTLVKVGVPLHHDLHYSWKGFASLADTDMRRVFLTSSRSVFDPGGQSVTDQERSASAVPTMFVWGRDDRFIPIDQAAAAAECLIDSRLEIFEDAGHFPHLDQPERFVQVVTDFLRSPN